MECVPSFLEQDDSPVSPNSNAGRSGEEKCWESRLNVDGGEPLSISSDIDDFFSVGCWIAYFLVLFRMRRMVVCCDYWLMSLLMIRWTSICNSCRSIFNFIIKKTFVLVRASCVMVVVKIIFE